MKPRRRIDCRDGYLNCGFATIALFAFIGFSAGMLFSIFGFDETITNRNPIVPPPSSILNSETSEFLSDDARVSDVTILPVADLKFFELLEVDHDSDSPRALLRLADGSARIVSEGDIVPSGLEVTAIYANYLLLKPTQSMLRLTKRKRDSSLSEVSEQTTASKNLISVAGAGKNGSRSVAARMYNGQLGRLEPPKEIYHIADDQILLERNYMLLQMDSPQIYRDALMEQMEGRGFEFMAIKPGSLYDHLGFRVGDVISEVNGEPIRSISDAIDMRNVISDTQEIKIKLLRGNSEMLMNYFLH